jgi:MscS family membrane protein
MDVALVAELHHRSKMTGNRKFLPFVLLAFCLHSASAQIPTAQPAAKESPKESAPQDPFNRLSPQSSVVSFLEACRAKNFERAARYLNLRQMPREQRQSDGPRLAQELGRILNGDAAFDVADLSRDPQGDLNDDLPADKEGVGSYPVGDKRLELQLERSTLRSGLAVWIFSADSVGIIPEIAQVTSDSPIEKYLPTVLVSWNLAGIPAWRWLALALIVIAVAALSRALERLGMIVLRPVVRMIAPKLERSFLRAIAGPAQLLLAGVFLRIGVAWIDPPALLRLYLARFCTFLLIAGVAWFIGNVADLVIEQIRLRLEARRSTLSRSALPLVSRGVKIAIFVFAATAVIGSWGYNTNTIWAGLGIGGIAIALAAQKTIENLFGGVAVVSDRPVTIGDFCKFGDRVGTVEDIGLRSTRVRTLDRTLVSVPNSEFSSMVLENFSQRDKVLFHPTLNLRRDTRPDQVRNILDAIRQILTDDPNVEAGNLPVRFIGAGSYSLDIEVFVYIRTPDNDEFLKIQQDLLLRIMDAIRAAGSALAIPTQASIFYSDKPQAAAAQEPAPELAGRPH